eukprot:Selendium_serpulae@DN6292_c0_g1_i2.p1
MAGPGEIGLDAFAFRQFDDAHYGGTRMPFGKEEFLKRVNEIVTKQQPPLKDGYAPFCKHYFVENFTDAVVAVEEITDANRKHLRSGYLSRCKEELPVLSRWFPVSAVTPQKAKFLDLIMYSREQIAKENEAMKKKTNGFNDSANYSIISIKAQMTDKELPMTPITAMRNALIGEGGSGVEINRDKYLESVAYWENHAEIKPDTD